MAKIKTVKFEIDGQSVAVDFTCSTKGVFGVNLNFVMLEKLGLKQKDVEGGSLGVIEQNLQKAITDYNNAKTTYKLKIAINFGANGKLIKDDGGYVLEKFITNPNLVLDISFSKVQSVIGLDFEILMEESRNGVISYYQGRFKKDHQGSINQVYKVINDFILINHKHLDSKTILIDYTETSYQNLISIREQLRKAALFLANLLGSDKIELILGSRDMKSIGG